MKLLFTETAWEDYVHWQETDKAVLKKLNALLKETLRTPFEGTGKPEPLRFALKGAWSRRINHEHRLIYLVKDDTLFVLQCRYHYEKSA